MILEPAEKFIITRQLGDPSDSNTYYVKAYIRNADSDALLATVNLTDKGSQRFRGEYYVPQDPSGQGFYITITTLVYTDAGCTSESADYERVEEQYLIQKRWNMSLGSGGGSDINYKKIAKLIREEIDKTPKEKIDLSLIESGLKDVLLTIKKIKFPEVKFPEIKFPDQKEIDLTKVFEGFKKIELFIEKSKVDLTPVSSQLKDLEDLIGSLDKFGKVIEEINKLYSLLKKMDEDNAFIGKIREVLNDNLSQKVLHGELEKKRKFIV